MQMEAVGKAPEGRLSRFFLVLIKHSRHMTRI